MNKRVVVTGLGVVSSIGIGREAFWKALVAGTSGISEISSFDTAQFSTHLGGEIKDFQPARFITEEKASCLGRASQLAISSARLALEDAALIPDILDRERCAVIIGTTMGESQVIEKINDGWIKRGEAGIDPELIMRYPCNVLSANIGIEFGFRGLNLVIPNACAAGNYCIGYAADIISRGGADIALAGGADAFSRIAFIGFNRLYAVAPQLCQPFDKNRKGMMVGEGAAVLALEPLDNALRRKARIYAEILGYGLSCDAHHMTAPHHSGIARAMKNALKESGLKPEDVDYLSAHGTGTPANDKAECQAIQEVFTGGLAGKLSVSSIKSMLGHTMGAASAIEAAACCLTIKEGLIPPTINFQAPDPECPVDCVPNVSRGKVVEVALNNASAFGGNNACLALSKFHPL